MQPSEFWAMPTVDWWVELDAKIAESRAVEERINEGRAGKAKGSAFTEAEWQAARERHRARKK
jgi:hypothetical protein